MKKVAFYNHKGGVGKSTSAINVTYFLQKTGKSVLVVDCDTQKNCFDFFVENADKKHLRETKYEKVMATFYGLLPELGEKINDYDYLIFDLPPAMTAEVKKIISDSDVVYVPTLLGNFEISGLADVTAEIQRQGTKLGGVFVTMYNKNYDKELLSEAQNTLKKRLLTTIVPFSTTVRESQKLGLSVEEYLDFKNAPNTKNARKICIAYEELTNELIKRCE
jgi:chromosome partitioning protein